MTTLLEEATKEAIKGDEIVLKGDRNTFHCDKEELKGNKDAIKRDG